ncbi:membrane protein insertase YidC [Avrilella dinanensis]|uniref:membrane protein insertase YidC n=1 Tax=Avrilella dinanensis TaxID=2008672 RepID=UPI00240A7771|nr:membrane protein insertase YidC [Avrilella dinanensis]
MEERKLDRNSIIGLVLISGLLAWFLMTSKSNETPADNKAETEQTANSVAVTNDSLQVAQLKQNSGAFAYGLDNARTQDIEVESELLKMTFSSKGGYLSKVEIKNQKRFTKDSDELVKLIDGDNAKLNIQLSTQDNRVLNTSELLFEPTVSKNGDNQVVSMKLKTSENNYLEYVYTIKPNDYMLDLTIKSVGLNQVLNVNAPATLNWELKTIRNEKSISYENRYSEVVYEYEGGKDDYLNASKSYTDANEKDVSYVAFKQHLFTSILLTDTPFETAKLVSENLVQNEDVDTLYLKKYVAEMPLKYTGGELNYNMNLYFGPADYNILNTYERNLDEIIPLGWGIFGWLNEWIIIPVYTFLIKFIPYGFAIILLTVVVRLLMSPVQYKSYVSQAKMKIIRPEVQEIAEKYKKDPMKKQQETMKLYQKAGVSPLSGCMPLFIQMPVFYALFMFFPSAFELRQKSFLWADDLSSYDSIFTLPFKIPFYGDHVSLFPILAGLATFVYMKMTTGDQTSSMPQQEGMPDMSKLMKIMIYISPVMMMFFFNNYASGLSLYYFTSNLITIGIMYVIKYRIINEDKVKAQIEENKTKERPKNKFQRKMEEMMEQAQQQKKK